MAECLRQIVPDRWASIRKRSSTKYFCVYTGGDKCSCVRCRSQLSCWSIRLKEIGQILRGWSRDNNNLFYIAFQQQLYELLALYRSTNATEHTSICYLN